MKRPTMSFSTLRLLATCLVAGWTAAVQKGLVTVEEIRKAVDVEPLRVKFSHDDKDLNAKFRRYVARMVENASRDARDGQKFE